MKFIIKTFQGMKFSLVSSLKELNRFVNTKGVMKGHNELKVNHHNESGYFQISLVGESMYSLQKTNWLRLRDTLPCFAVSNELNKFLQQTRLGIHSITIIFEDQYIQFNGYNLFIPDLRSLNLGNVSYGVGVYM